MFILSTVWGWLFILGFGFAAYFDLRYKKVPELFSIMMWVALACSGLPLSLSVYFFVFTWGLNWLVLTLTNKQAYGWADVLILPPYVAFLSSISVNAVWIIYTMVGLSFMVSGWLLTQQRRADLGIEYMFERPDASQVPFIPFLALGFVIGLFV